MLLPKKFPVKLFGLILSKKFSSQNIWLDFAKKIFKPKYLAWFYRKNVQAKSPDPWAQVVAKFFKKSDQMELVFSKIKNEISANLAGPNGLQSMAMLLKVCYILVNFCFIYFLVYFFHPRKKSKWHGKQSHPNFFKKFDIKIPWHFLQKFWNKNLNKNKKSNKKPLLDYIDNL